MPVFFPFFVRIEQNYCHLYKYQPIQCGGKSWTVVTGYAITEKAVHRVDDVANHSYGQDIQTIFDRIYEKENNHEQIDEAIRRNVKILAHFYSPFCISIENSANYLTNLYDAS